MKSSVVDTAGWLQHPIDFMCHDFNSKQTVNIMTINQVARIDDQVKINHVLISVSDKSGLDRLAPALIEQNEKLTIFSTGGTFGYLENLLGPSAGRHLVQVADYTGQPETQGGLVKTLDFKIYLGLLTETYNADHQQDLARTHAVPIDMVVVNLYPFVKTIARSDVTVEQARGNIDIGGPCMIRASAKNFLRVAPVVDPQDYDWIVSSLQRHQGALPLDARFELAQKAFAHTADYDRAIADYLGKQRVADARSYYGFSEQ
jgi:phosphoribosylaminoimidazolecarboxamide formyltransferase/IMP cyclohydrolase